MDEPKVARILAPAVRAQLGQRLRAIYEPVVEEGVPERFRLLVDRLTEIRQASSDGKI